MTLRIDEIPSYERLSETCAQILCDTVRRVPEAVLALATGYSPQLAYRLFVQMMKADGVDAGRIRIVKLDEWLGLPDDDPATCEYFLQREIIRPLGISPDRYIAFDPLCADARTECRRVEQAVRAWGGIDVMVLGVGRNGHLGLNEPGSELRCAAHPAILASRTRDHPMLRSARSPVTHGMTLGLDSIFNADRILLLITGEGKGRVLEYLRKGSVSAAIPASMLHLHRNVTCLADMTIRE